MKNLFWLYWLAGVVFLALGIPGIALVFFVMALGITHMM